MASKLKNPSKFTFLDFAKTVLSKSAAPITAKQIWQEGERIGLDKQLGSVGKTPWATLGAQLYTAAKKSGSGIRAVDDKPKRFALEASVPASAPVLPVPKTVARKSAAAKTYSFTECAQKVLERFGGKKPMHYREITEKAREQGWLNSSGLTPEATMYAQIVTEIGNRRKRGEQQRFVQHGRGLVGLSQWLGDGLRLRIEEHNKNVRKKLHNYLASISPKAFEELIGQLLGTMGFEAPQVTGRSGDGGIDVRGTWVITDGVRIKMAVQVKRWKHNVQAPVVQNVRGSLATDERGLIITTSDFSKGAREEAEDPKKSSPISLINGEQLVRLLAENNIGVARESADILDFDPDGIDNKE